MSNVLCIILTVILAIVFGSFVIVVDGLIEKYERKKKNAVIYGLNQNKKYRIK